MGLTLWRWGLFGGVSLTASFTFLGDCCERFIVTTFLPCRAGVNHVANHPQGSTDKEDGHDEVEDVWCVHRGRRKLA